MGCDMFFYGIQENRKVLKNYWHLHEVTVTIPTIDELLQWAHEAKIHVHITYDGDYKVNIWKIKIWDMPPDNWYQLESTDFNKIYQFLHEKLKEL